MIGSSIIERLDRLQQGARAIWQRHQRWLRPLLQAIVLLACLGYLAFNLRQIQQYRHLLRFHAGYLLASLAMTLLALALGALGWGFVLRCIGMRFPWSLVSNAHLSSNLAKYVPGYGWQLVGKVYLMNQAGMSTKKVSLAMFIELAVLFLSGAVLAGSVALGFPVTPDEVLRTFVLLAGAGAILFLAAMPRVLPIIGRRFRVQELQIAAGAYWTAVSVIMLGWIALALSFYLLGAAIIAVDIGLLPIFVFTLAGSFLVSLAVLFIPGGIGVRESVMVYLLGASIGATPAVILAAVSRLAWLLGELIAAGFARLWLKRANSPA